tara:strand:- start:68 stop:706 length:639 start_codon:yes stop_codon:yes gene_type:complete
MKNIINGRPVYSKFKYLIDRILASLIIVAFFPIIMLLIFTVRVKLGPPVLFKQSRSGYKGKIFNIYKIRSMTNARDLNGELLTDSERLTAFGHWLRKTSIDEIPGLINILLGEMSFVGPRPLMSKYLPLYSKEQFRRHEVKPGITGWAQVNGRNSISWEDKFKYDVWYVDNCNIFIDMKILFMTFIKVLKKDGVDLDKDVTMPLFRGSEKLK